MEYILLIQCVIFILMHALVYFSANGLAVSAEMWTVFTEVLPNRSSLQSVSQINIHDCVDDVFVELSFPGRELRVR